MEYIVEASKVPWTENPRPDRKGYFEKMLGDGLDGRPHAIFARQPTGAVNEPHFHTERQFVVLLEGAMTFPKRPLTPIGVHYVDARTPYGPFIGGSGMVMAVLRHKPAPITYMSEPEGHKRRNVHGREFFAQSELLQGGAKGPERKQLLGKEGEESPTALLWKYPAGSSIARGPAPFARFSFILEGTAMLNGQTYGPQTLFFESGDGPFASLRAGESGASWLTLTFDQGRDA